MEVKVHLLSSSDSIPAEFVFLPGAVHDRRGLQTLCLQLLPGSEVYGDKDFTDGELEDDLKQTD
jgi:hypothetical protein